MADGLTLEVAAPVDKILVISRNGQCHRYECGAIEDTAESITDVLELTEDAREYDAEVVKSLRCSRTR